ncbi:MAG: three-Cys-motif partner protein TcmP [Saprospiraceae bacterium]
MEQPSKIIMYDHSAAKVRLLKEYMAAYLGILANADWINDVYLYDLFCGPGVYENDGLGSPIIFLQEIIRAHELIASPRNKPTKFYCIFNDQDKEKVNKLEKNITENTLDISKYGNIKFSTEDYKVVLADVVNQISTFKNERGFVFIDPYGYSEVSLKDIDALTNTGKSEVLLFMPTHHMYRFKDNGTPECLMKFMDDLNISEKIKGVKGLEFIEIVMNGFKLKLRNKVYVDSFVIKRDLNQFFCLFFFTSNTLGYLKMLEAKWKIDKEDGRGWHGVQEENLFSQLNDTANTDKLRNLLINFLKSGPKSSGDLFEFVIHNRFLPKHGTEILKSIQDKLDVVDKFGKKAPKGAFYVTYSNFKENPNKVIIKLK